MRVLLALLGAVVLAGTTSSVLRTLVIPRGLSSRLSSVVTRLVRWCFVQLADRFGSYEVRDRLLAPQAPVSVLTLLTTWLAAYLLGYALLQGGVSGQSVHAAFREAGSSFFTLGFASTDRSWPQVVDFVAGATGPVIIALQIAYLPTLYGAYNRRETDVTLLQSRAGEPAWGPELLARHQLVGIVDSLPGFYGQWERWAADVAESHANYPVLVDFRSPKPLRSWTVGLLAVLDSAAMYLATAPDRAPSEARLCLRMGFTCLRDVADSVGLTYDPDPRPEGELQLGFEEFQRAVRRLAEVNFPMERSAEAAWPHFRGWRVNYENIAYQLTTRVDAVPALWSGPRRRLVTAMAPNRPADRLPGSPAVSPPEHRVR